MLSFIRGSLPIKQGTPLETSSLTVHATVVVTFSSASRYPTITSQGMALDADCHGKSYIYIYISLTAPVYPVFVRSRPGEIPRSGTNKTISTLPLTVLLLYIHKYLYRIWTTVHELRRRDDDCHACLWTLDHLSHPEFNIVIEFKMAPTITIPAQGGMFHTFQGVTPRKPAAEQQENPKSASSGTAKRITTPHACAECKRRKM